MTRSPALKRLDEPTVRQLIDLARRLEQVGAGLKAALVPVGRRREALDMYFESPTRKALLDRFRSLGSAQMQELVALMWLGHEDGGKTRFDWPALLEDARRCCTDGADALLLVDRNRLSDYLETGLAKLSPVRLI